MIDWWNPPKAMVYIPINVFGPDDGYQISHPKEMEWAQAEDANAIMQGIGWFWFWGNEGSEWRMVWNGEAAIGPLEAA